MIVSRATIGLDGRSFIGALFLLYGKRQEAKGKRQEAEGRRERLTASGCEFFAVAIGTLKTPDWFMKIDDGSADGSQDDAIAPFMFRLVQCPICGLNQRFG